LQWANPFLQFPLPKALPQALKYLRTLLSSTVTDPDHWLSLCHKLTWPQGLEYSIAPRWRTMMDPDWGSLPDRPSPLAVDRATKQLSIERALEKRAVTRADANTIHSARIVLNFPRGKFGAPRRRASYKRGQATTIEPLRGSDAPGYIASIQQVLARSKPSRARHGRRSTWVEEFLVQWGPEHYTFEEALEQYYLGFDIDSITSLKSTFSSRDLLSFVATKRPT
jgi:hypothetical protein